jgi:uncharacterized protein (DUF3820 family)
MLEIPVGKYAGCDLYELSTDQVFSLWASWNGFPKKRQHPMFKHIAARKNEMIRDRARFAHIPPAHVKSDDPLFNAVATHGKYTNHRMVTLADDVLRGMRGVYAPESGLRIDPELKADMYSKCCAEWERRYPTPKIASGYVLPHGRYKGQNVNSIKTERLALLLVQYRDGRTVEGCTKAMQQEIHEACLAELHRRDKPCAKPPKRKKSNAEHLADFERDREPYTMPNGVTISIPAGTWIDPDEICPFE